MAKETKTEQQEMTTEIAVNNLASLLGSNELKLNKTDHIVLEKSLVLLANTSKEVEILRNRVAELELLTKKKK